MDSESFVGDFGVGLPMDNRYMNQLNLGGMGGAMGTSANDLMNPAGLDFSSTMMMMDANTSLVGPPGSSTGMIDFPDELNSPKNNATTGTSGIASAVISTSSTSSTDATMSSSEAIPFPAALANDPPLNMNANAAVAAQNRAAMNASAAMGFPGMDMTSNAMAGNLNGNINMSSAMNNGVSMSMPMNMAMNPTMAANGFMPDMNMGLAMNNMFMGGAYPMQTQMNGMMMGMNPQMYFTPQQQQQQQEYLRMLQQRQFAMQQQLQANAQAQAGQPQNTAAAAAQLRQQQLQQQMAAMQNQAAQMANGIAGGTQVSTAQQVRPTSQVPQVSTATTTAPANVASAQRQFQPNTPAQHAQVNKPAGTTPSGSTTRQPWHSPADTPLRKEMLSHIMRVLQSQKSNAPANWLQRLPEMARRLEEECYRISTSREEYANTSTLQGRLKNIVRQAQTQQRDRVTTSSQGAPARSQGPTPSAVSQPVSSAPALNPAPISFPGSDTVPQQTANVHMKPSPAVPQPFQMPLELQVPSAPVKVETSQPQAIPMPPELQNPAAQANGSRTSIPADSVASQQSMVDAVAANNAVAAMAAANQSRSAQFLRQFKARAQQVTSALEEKQTREYHNKLQSMTTSDMMNANSKGVLQRQQQRLLLLRHAMWCKAADGACVATPNCGEMKRLWQHMGNCQETTSCSYSHCISSKYVLSHFQQCENQKCLVCQLLRFPVEVKEKNGSLMMDADRALQQIQAASERRQAMLQGQMASGSQSQPAVAQPVAPSVNNQQQTMTGAGGAMGFQTQGAVNGQTLMPQQPDATAQSRTAVGVPTQPQRTPQPPSAPAATVAGLTEEENRQLALIQQRLRGVSLEQLNLNSKKLENYAEQVRSQVNAIMNECRQIMQMRNTTQDPALQSRYDAEVQAKKLTLQDLHQKYKKCTSQHRIVKHVISARINGAPMGGLSQPAPNQMPSSQPVQPGQPVQPVQPQSTQPVSNPNQFSVSMQPLAMPPGLQGVPQAPPQVPQPVPMPAHLQQQQPQHSFSAQLQMAQSSLVQSQTSMPNDPTVPSQTTNDIIGQSLGISLGDNGLGMAGKPLEMPSDLQSFTPAPITSAAPPVTATTAPASTAPVPTPAPASMPTPAPAPVGAPVKSPEPIKSEPSVNPLTMNNSKLNAMMMEHKRMDAAKVKAEPAAVTVSTSASALPVAPMLSPPTATATPAAGDTPTSMLNELTNEQLKQHIESLVIGYNATMQPATLKKRLEGLLKGMMEHKFGWVFSSPVDPVALDIPNYFKIIRRPMDLGTIKKKLDAGVYKHMDQFAADVRLTFENAKTYNSEDQDVYNLAKDMLNDFNAEMRKLEAEVYEEERQARAKESACRLCGVERMVFEPAVLYCNGECNSRIRRNCYYFCSPDNKYHCCQPCFNNLSDEIRGNEGKTYRKTELSKKKNDEVHEEPWVQCDKCNRWVHQICALFNGKIDAEKKPQVVKSESNGKTSGPGSQSSSHSISSTPGSEFLCPECLLEHRVKEPEKYTVGKHAFNAKDLMRTKLSDFLERRIYKALQEEREDEARWTNRNVKDVATAEHLTVRLVSNIEKQLMVRDKMFQRYKDSHKYTSEHRFKSKCICMFQEIHGVSVLLFGMYVHEFDEQEAECNSRRVYISYLDSVNYFEPAHLRTKVYHELLIAYLDFVRQRGFHTAHLWACPPLKGDDYILYCHPESQKTPKSDRLRQWYVDMLTKAQQEGVALHISNLYDEYWRNNNTACALPYFEGDYWVGLAEEVIEKLDAEKPKKSKNKRKSETKKPSKKSKKSKTKRRKTSTAGSGGEHEDNATGSDGEGDGNDDEEGDASMDEPATAVEKKERAITSLDDVDRTVTDPLMKKMGEVIEPMKDDFIVVKLQPYCRLCNTPVLKGTLWRDPTTSTALGLNPKTVHVTVCDGCYQKAKATPNARLQEQLKHLQPEEVKWPEKCADPDEVNDSEYFDTRQAFLSLCQGNHYQFDELRRAKHSSMMALYHLGNPNPNAYVYECNACTRDIVTGNRWHCHTCPDFDVCDACYAKEKHEHPLEKIPTSGVAGAGGAGGQLQGSLSEEQRRQRDQRAKNVRLHMQLLVHSSSCDGSCGSGNCEKMKELMRHGAVCKQRALGGCTVCRRVWALLQLHARQCRQYECKVPRCHDLREHVRKLQLQQQLMDDRRRAAVTQQYRQMQSGGQPSGGDDDPTGGA